MTQVTTYNCQTCNEDVAKFQDQIDNPFNCPKCSKSLVFKLVDGCVLLQRDLPSPPQKTIHLLSHLALASLVVSGASLFILLCSRYDVGRLTQDIAAIFLTICVPLSLVLGSTGAIIGKHKGIYTKLCWVLPLLATLRMLLRILKIF